MGSRQLWVQLLVSDKELVNFDRPKMYSCETKPFRNQPGPVLPPKAYESPLVWNWRALVPEFWKRKKKEIAGGLWSFWNWPSLISNQTVTSFHYRLNNQPCSFLTQQRCGCVTESKSPTWYAGQPRCRSSRWRGCPCWRERSGLNRSPGSNLIKRPWLAHKKIFKKRKGIPFKRFPVVSFSNTW